MKNLCINFQKNKSTKDAEEMERRFIYCGMNRSLPREDSVPYEAMGKENKKVLSLNY